MKKIALLTFFCLLSIFGYSQVPTPNPCGQSRCVNETVVYGDNPIDPNATYTNLSVSPATTNNIISNGTQLEVTFTATGTYTITITKEIPGCPPVTSTCEVIVNPLQVPTITTVIVCEGSPAATLTSTVPGTFSGVGIIGNTFNAGTLTSGQYNVIFTPDPGTCVDTTPISDNNEITPGPNPPVIGSN
jgi:hypothetical protein